MTIFNWYQIGVMVLFALGMIVIGLEVRSIKKQIKSDCGAIYGVKGYVKTKKPIIVDNVEEEDEKLKKLYDILDVQEEPNNGSIFYEGATKMQE